MSEEQVKVEAPEHECGICAYWGTTKHIQYYSSPTTVQETHEELLKGVWMVSRGYVKLDELCEMHQAYLKQLDRKHEEKLLKDYMEREKKEEEEREAQERKQKMEADTKRMGDIRERLQGLRGEK